MLYYYPDYFYDFKCEGGVECPDSCCHVWKIEVDAPTLKKYGKVSGQLGRRMAEKIDKKTGVITPHGEENRCEFLNDDNLCDIILTLGEDYLCQTCRTHPRHEEEYRNVRERSIAISCPVACRRLLLREEPVAILSDSDSKTDRRDRYFDAPLFEQILYVRDRLLEIAQNRRLRVGSRMALALGLAHDVERRLRTRRERKGRGPFKKHPKFGDEEKEKIIRLSDAYCKADADACKLLLERVKKKAGGAKDVVAWSASGGDAPPKDILTDMIFALSTLEPLKKSWIPYLYSTINIRNEMTDDEYRDARREFENAITDAQLEQLLFYFIYLYCCGSAYDGMLLAKIKMAVSNTVLIRELWLMKWLEDDGRLTIDGQAWIAHEFVREIENSDENIEQWDSLMQRNPRFSLKRLMSVLT